MWIFSYKTPFKIICQSQIETVYTKKKKKNGQYFPNKEIFSFIFNCSCYSILILMGLLIMLILISILVALIQRIIK